MKNYSIFNSYFFIHHWLSIVRGGYLKMEQICNIRKKSKCSADCFYVLDHASTSCTFQLKIKEAIHIQREHCIASY